MDNPRSRWIQMAHEHGVRFTRQIERHQAMVDTIAEVYSPKGLIELGTLLVLEGTERLKNDRDH